MIHKKKIYSSVKSVTPPVLFTLFKKTPLYPIAKKIFSGAGVLKPEWHTVHAGILKGGKLFLSGNEIWQKEILDGTYDKFFFDYIKKLDLRGKTLLDIGSHIGFHALCFGKIVGLNGHVLTFEPNVFNAGRIAINLAANKDVSSNIELFRYALSSTDGEEDFLFTDNVDGGMSSGSFIDSADTIWNKNVYETETGYKRTRVQTRKVDSLEQIASGTLKPYLIKIDVEGAEGAVLEGAKMTIEKYKPILLLEVHSIYNMYSTMSFLQKMDYRIELLKKENDGRCFLTATAK